MNQNLVPDELAIRRTIAERLRELRMLRSIKRALDRYRSEREAADAIRKLSDDPTATVEDRLEADNG